MTSYSSRFLGAPLPQSSGASSTGATSRDDGGGASSMQPSAVAQQKALIDAILQERKQEREIRSSNRNRLSRFTSVAQEAHRSSSAGVTESILRMKKDRHQLGGHFNEQGSGNESRPSHSRTGSQGGCTTTTRDETLSSARGQGVASAGASPPQNPTRTERLLGGRADLLRKHCCGVGRSCHELGDDEEEDDNGGGHVCVVRTNVAELLFSSTAAGTSTQGVDKRSAAVTDSRPNPSDTATPPPTVNSRGNDDGSSSNCSSVTTTASVPSGVSSGSRQHPWQDRCAGPIPLSLRGLLERRTPPSTASVTSTDEDPSVAAGARQIHSAQPGDVASLVSVQASSASATDVATVTAADVPPPRQPKALPRPSKPKVRPRDAAAVAGGSGAVKSILKRHPIPRRHGRKVHFAEEHLVTSASSSLLRLSKDGPPVPLASLFSDDHNAGNEELKQLVAEDTRQGTLRSDASDGIRDEEMWGADSETFNREWGLPSPCGGATSAAASSTIIRNVVTSSGPRRQPEISQQQQPDRNAFLRRSFHTGLSMEEAKLMHAIVAVNERLKKVGYSKFVGGGEQLVDSGQEDFRPQLGVPAGSSATSDIADSAGVAVMTGATQQPTSAALAPRFVVVTRNGGVVVPRSTSAPAAVTSRSAPTPTPLASDCRRVVVAAEPAAVGGEGLPPGQIAAALPKRLPDHHGLVRRDRFGKRMSVIPR